jgi:hypothetical protein
MKVYWGVDVQIHIFLTSALAGAEWSASRPGCFTPGINCIGGWVDPRAGLDNVENILGCYQDSNSNPSVIQPVASHYTKYTIPASVTWVRFF